jgi:hypothetical protein
VDFREAVHCVPGDGTAPVHSEAPTRRQPPERVEDAGVVWVVEDRGLKDELGNGSTAFPGGVGDSLCGFALLKLPDEVLP